MLSYRTQAMFASAVSLAPADDSGAEAVDTFRRVTISGETFEIKVPYSAGHTLTEAEASVLNQTFTENIRNNSAGRIKAAKEAAETNGTPFSLDTPIGGEGEDAGKTLRQLIQEYADTYEFGVRTQRSSEPADPVEREARSIAREAITAQLRAKGIKRKDVTEEAFEQALQKHSKNPQILKEAQRRVKAKNDIGLDELGLDLSDSAPAEEAAA